MNRADLQAVALRRLEAAKCLLSNDHTDSAYYLAGYAIECGLKAVIARQFREHDFPDKKTVMDSYTHDLVKLVRVAGFEAKLNEDMDQSVDLKLNWLIVKDWSEDSRYENRNQLQAEALLAAVSDPSSGVLTWIQQHWSETLTAKRVSSCSMPSTRSTFA